MRLRQKSIVWPVVNASCPRSGLDPTTISHHANHASAGTSTATQRRSGARVHVLCTRHPAATATPLPADASASVNPAASAPSARRPRLRAAAHAIAPNSARLWLYPTGYSET